MPKSCGICRRRDAKTELRDPTERTMNSISDVALVHSTQKAASCPRRGDSVAHRRATVLFLGWEDCLKEYQGTIEVHVH